MDLDDRVALVTGAGVRVGAALAQGLAEAGCHVALHYHRSRGPAGETAATVRATGREAALLQADLTDAVAARDLADRVLKAFGRLDIVINSAAVMERQPIEAVTPASWDRTFQINLRAPFFVVQGAIEVLRRARGHVINIADVAAYRPWPAYVPHSASKAGLVMLTRALARALAPDVQVNAVAPGPVLLPADWGDDEMRQTVARVPLGRLGHPDDVVSAVRYLLGAGDYVTGTTLVVDGGELLR
jgi:NAD(P)-dependent dehydrogenase (short-subunit alcohol dehydrogenase family)